MHSVSIKYEGKTAAIAQRFSVKLGKSMHVASIMWPLRIAYHPTHTGGSDQCRNIASISAPQNAALASNQALFRSPTPLFPSYPSIVMMIETIIGW